MIIVIILFHTNLLFTKPIPYNIKQILLEFYVMKITSFWQMPQQYVGIVFPLMFSPSFCSIALAF
jgi:hypothetical protein